MVESVDVDVRAGHDLRGDGVNYVARFAKVVPGDDLYVFRLKFDGLLPAGEPEGVAG